MKTLRRLTFILQLSAFIFLVGCATTTEKTGTIKLPPVEYVR